MHKQEESFFWIVVIIAYVVGLAQYAPAMIDSAQYSKVVVFQLDEVSMDESGPLRYLKDIFVLVFSIFWVVRYQKIIIENGINKFGLLYISWFFVICFVGVLGYFFSKSPFYLAVAGLRWLLLLHASIGVFIASNKINRDEKGQLIIFKFLVVLALVEMSMSIYQASIASSIIGVGMGASRVSGFLSNAGVAASFAISVALLSMFLEHIKIGYRLILSMMCMVIALASGTRGAMISIFFIVTSLFLDFLNSKKFKAFKGIFIVFLVPVVAVCAIAMFGYMISIVDRGDMIASQFESGGRIANLAMRWNDFISAGILKIMFGAGLGVGTNTAYYMVLNRGMDPESVEFNWLIDNSFMTSMFQFGVIGSLVFWSGIVLFFTKIFKVTRSVANFKFWIVVYVFFSWAAGGNPFEQYFIMIGVLGSLGICYWKSRYELLLLLKIPR